MRTCTLLFSVAIHVALLGAAFVTRVVATDELPTPRQPLIFVSTTIPPPPAVVSRPRVEQSPTPPTGRNLAPVEAPPQIVAEHASASLDALPLPDGVLIGADAAPPLIAAPPPPPPPAPEPRGPIPVGGVISAPRKIVDVRPVYPPIAAAARKEGLVILEAEIDEGGNVRRVKVLRSEPLLDQAAVDAVRQWRFTPTLLNGSPVPVVMTVTVRFALN